MRKRSDKIGKIVSLAAAEERRFGAATGESRRRLEEQMVRLGELNAYRQNYAELSQSMRGVSSAHWKDYQNFMRRLDQAVRSQEQIVRDSEQNLELHRRRWLAKRQRLESLQRVLESCRDEEAMFAERRRQRALDDMPTPDDLYPEDPEA